MSEALNVQNLTLNDAARARSSFGKPGAAQRGRREPFLKGPVSLAWLKQAAKLPGKAFQVAVALRYRCGVERTLAVKLSSALLREFGVERDAKGTCGAAAGGRRTD